MQIRSKNSCAHITALDTLRSPRNRECEECIKLGDTGTFFQIESDEAQPRRGSVEERSLQTVNEHRRRGRNAGSARQRQFGERFWVHLRTCQTCGITLCCDSSPNRHASGHAQATGHPVIASAEPGERWLYCYPDEAFAMY